MLDLYVLLASTVAMFLLGLTILVRNIHNRTFQLFGLLTLSSIIWFVANYLTNHIEGYSAQLFFNKLSLFMGFLLIQSVWLLSLYFPRKITQHKIQRKISIFLTPILAVLTIFTDQIVSSVIYRPEKRITDINTGNLYFIYVAVAAIFFGFLLFNFWKSYKSSKLTRLERQQVLYASIGLLLSFVWSILTAALIPSLTGNWEISKYGAIGAWFIVSFISYAIIRHKLFDIRLIIARSVAYLLLLATLVGLYGLVVFGLTDLVFGDSVFSEKVVPIFTALLLVFTSPYLRSVFDKVTNRLFYRDAYDPQVFLDQLNKELVSNADIEALLSRCSEVIVSNLKADYCLFGLKETAYTEQRIIGSSNKQFDAEDVEFVRRLTPSIKQAVIVADDLDEDHELKKKLRKYNIEILARLTSDIEREVEGLGYLVLGQKKSGNPYNRQDINIIEIIANELVIAIQNALRFEEIEKFNITLQEKVDDATKQLRKTNEKLKQLDETKDEFISMASHQLRTPLTSVKGYLSMVLEGDAGEVSPMQQKLLDQAFVSSQRMVYLIADLLNVSRLRTGKFVIEPVESNLAEVVEGEIGQLKETAAGRGLELTYNKPENFPKLYLDETKIRQVIMNFTDNAIYYTPKGGNIEVKLEDKGESIELTVNDDGMGVPKAEQPHLFGKFYRAGNAQKARPDGTGLGLFMAKKVVIAQGGSIIFRSEEGKGSTFGFTFPKSKLQSPNQIQPPAEPDEE